LASEKRGVGIIGTGRRGYDLGRCIIDLIDETDLEIRALCNRTRARMEEVEQAFASAYREKGASPAIRMYEQYGDLIDDPDVQLIIIVSPQYVHREHAVAALQSGKKVFLDKPMAHDLENAISIRRAEIRTENPLFIGFTRRYEQIWLKAHELVKGGVIGDPKMILVRDVLPYHIYFHDWHRRLQWSAGVLGDKICHLFDACSWFAGSLPAQLSSFGGRTVFVPEKHPPLRCSECDRDCPYRVVTKDDQPRPDMMTDFSSSRARETDLEKMHDICVWLPGADINDHGVINIRYENDIKASVFWTVFGFDTDDQEVLEIVGDRGKIVLTRQIGELLVVSEYGKRQERLNLRSDSFEKTHFGADHQLIRELDKFCRGEGPVVSGDAGIEASRLVEAAHRSVRNNGELIQMRDIEDA
jgi:predicted dehydrogenase